ncbi:sugar phosphate nucleotidyltransferase [Bacillus sp. CGMCC 1.16541]|uniref:sugar phosphate nucleotidyltransferase n=1 Tax=Bacillus sp. CGMCC 1.16541 TaxID=2185143 RepID=UPI000D73809F|nr:sugar phosphate nucleotidyltransferase [Bacillus sp. CGMCC 1.16541]
MKGIILAGGKGTRLKPLTDEVPKPMLPLCGKPVMEYSIELLKEHGITEIGVTLQHLHYHITSYFGDGSKWGVRLHYFIEKEPLGTAGSLQNAHKFIDDDCVIISGDALTSIHLTSAIAHHNDQNAVMTIITKEVKNPLDYGMVLRNAAGFVKKFVEKPRKHEITSNLINTGVYIITKKVLNYIEENKSVDFSLDLIPKLLKHKERVCSYLTDDYWIDIGQIHHYRQAHNDLLSQRYTLSSLSSSYVEEDVLVEEQVTIHSPVYIGKGAIIRKGAVIGPYTTIGSGSVVGASSLISHSILSQETAVGNNCQIHEATIAPHVRIQKGTTLSKSVVGKEWEKTKEQESIADMEHSLFVNGRMIIDTQASISPQIIFRLCQALQMSFPSSSTIIVGSDEHICSTMFSHLVISGLQVQNFQVHTMGALSLPLFRYYKAQKKGEYAVYLYKDSTREEHELSLEIYDQKGCLIDTMTEWRIEKQYKNVAELDIKVDRMNPIVTIESNKSDYIDYLVHSIDIPSVIGANSSVVVICPPYMQEVVQRVCNELHIRRYVTCKHEIEQDVAMLINRYRASFAMVIDDIGESFLLYDENGDLLTETQVLALYIYSVSLTKKLPFIPIPVHYSSSLELLANDLHEKLIRVKSQKRDLLNVLGPTHFQVDALYAFCQMVELLSVQLHSISALIKTVPNIHVEKENVFCPWESQGLVMRKLVEEFDDRQIELIDGLKIYHPNQGWTLILPHGEIPALTIYSEATNEVLAKKFSSDVMKKIREYQKV